MGGGGREMGGERTLHRIERRGKQHEYYRDKDTEGTYAREKYRRKFIDCGICFDNNLLLFLWFSMYIA